MRVFVYYDTTEDPWGGINTFFKNFKKYCKSRSDIEVVENVNDEYDIFFYGAASFGINKEVDYNFILDIKKNKNCKIVHRLDGLRICYNGKGVPNDYIQLRLTELDDFIVFQSNYSFECFSANGYNKNNWKIIYNGSDHYNFNLDGRKYNLQKKIKVISINWSSNINKGYEVIAELSKYNKLYDVTFIGNWNKSIVDSNVKIMGPMKQEKLIKYLKQNDVFLHAAINEPCPNVVLEALSSGLPVLHNLTGGTHEIVGEMGFILPEIFNNTTIELLHKAIHDQYLIKIDHIKRNRYKLSFDRTMDEYISLFKRLL